jgi:Domain of unknown function (DUF397)
MTVVSQPVGRQWIKASSCATYHCVELACDGDMIAMRDSKNPTAVQRYTCAEFAAFLDGAKKGEFDSLLVPQRRRGGVFNPA